MHDITVHIYIDIIIRLGEFALPQRAGSFRLKARVSASSPFSLLSVFFPLSDFHAYSNLLPVPCKGRVVYYSDSGSSGLTRVCNPPDVIALLIADGAPDLGKRNIEDCAR